MTSELLDLKKDTVAIIDMQQAQCLPLIKKNTSNKPVRSVLVKSSLSDGSRNSSAEPDCSQVSNGGSKRITKAFPGTGSLLRVESFRGENEKLTKIEESKVL